ncbi:MAG: hypothetical protein J0I98_03900 [Mesorhizobium sp.]|nr:hypothetical protein [Mesorhizobium sp.]MBN9241916.1 hypothetical protein [Mesorhizobium sp.]
MNEISQPSSEGTPPATLPPALRKPRLRRWEAVEYLKLVYGIELATATLARWYSQRSDGPAVQRLNRTPLYPKAGENGLDDWACKKLGIDPSAEGSVHA